MRLRTADRTIEGVEGLRRVVVFAFGFGVFSCVKKHLVVVIGSLATARGGFQRQNDYRRWLKTTGDDSSEILKTKIVIL